MNTVKGLGLRGQLVLTFLAMGAIALTTYRVWPGVEDQRATIAALRERSRALDAEIQLALNLKRRLPELEREVRNLETQLEELAAVLPRQREDAALVRQFETLANRSRLAINTISPQRLRPMELYDEYPITLDVEGSYHDIATFFARLAEQPRLFNVARLHLQHQPNVPGRPIRADFEVVTYIYKPTAAPTVES